MVLTENSVGLLSLALAYGDAVRAGAPSADIDHHARRLLAESRRGCARALRDTGEGGGVPDGAILLEQIADDIEQPSIPRTTTRDLAGR